MKGPLIRFTLIDNEQTHELETYRGEYRSLMMLINDHLYHENFGECLGMGRCGTCTVIVEQQQQEFTAFNRNETATLEKEGIFDTRVHLACQILIDEKLAGAVLRIYPTE